MKLDDLGGRAGRESGDAQLGIQQVAVLGGEVRVTVGAGQRAVRAGDLPEEPVEDLQVELALHRCERQRPHAVRPEVEHRRAQGLSLLRDAELEHVNQLPIRDRGQDVDVDPVEGGDVRLLMVAVLRQRRADRRHGVRVHLVGRDALDDGDAAAEPLAVQ